ncbi:MAG TPA: 2-phosphosulfolactate phosphatase, partial [Bacillota bacterium]
MEIDVALTAATARADQIRGRVVCVIDVLRASSTITAALAAGAAAVRPVATVEAALALRDQLRAEGIDVVLAGERGGDPPPGFDLGNSPRDCTPERVGGRELILTTTNGTLAVDRAQRLGAQRIYVGAFVNLYPVVAALEDDPASRAGILLYAAGSDGLVSMEDTVCAGRIVRELSLRVPGLRLRDAARIASRA